MAIWNRKLPKAWWAPALTEKYMLCYWASFFIESLCLFFRLVYLVSVNEIAHLNLCGVIFGLFLKFYSPWSFEISLVFSQLERRSICGYCFILSCAERVKHMFLHKVCAMVLSLIDDSEVNVLARQSSSFMPPLFVLPHSFFFMVFMYHL